MMVVVDSRLVSELKRKLTGLQDFYEGESDYQRGFRDGGNHMVGQASKLVDEFWNGITQQDNT